MKKMAIIILAVVTFNSCSKVSFSPANGALESTSAVTSPTTPAVTCQPGQTKITRPTKVLFMVDQSGSNINGPYEYPGAATDATKTFRTKVMSDFVNTNQSKIHVSWGLSVFNSKASTSLMPSPTTAPYSNVNDFKTGLTNFKNRTDVGETPYKAALTAAYNMIKTDMLSSPKETAYLIAFITDGYPTDYCPGGATEVLCPGRILESQIDTDVRKIVDLNVRNVKFSSVYYGKPDGDATSRLQRMADTGLGEFVDANKTSNIDLNDILDIQQEICVTP